MGQLETAFIIAASLKFCLIYCASVRRMNGNANIMNTVCLSYFKPSMFGSSGGVTLFEPGVSVLFLRFVNKNLLTVPSSFNFSRMHVFINRVAAPI